MAPNLGICYAQPFWDDGETLTTTDTSIVLPLHVGRDYFDEIHLFVPFRESATDRGPIDLALGTSDSLVPGLDRDRVVVHGLPFKTSAREWYAVRGVGDVARAARTIGAGVGACDLVWLPGPPHVPTVLCYAQCRRRGVPSFLFLRSDQAAEIDAQEFRGLLSAKQALGRHVLPRIERSLVERVPTLVAGPGLYEKYRNRTDDLHVVRAVHLSERRVLDEPSERSDDGPLRLLYVGRLVPVKGVERLIEAVERLVTDGRDVTLDVVGDGKSARKLRERAASSSAAEAITFHGFVPFGDELFAKYRTADAFVLPSYSEGFPNVLLEAAAHGVPIVSTRVGGIDELLGHEREGLLVPPGDSGAIAAAVARLDDDPKLRDHLVRNAIDTAREHTVERQREKVIDVLKEHFPNLV